MTATYPTRGRLRECRLYRFYVTHPETGETVLGYIGETGRQPFERLLEHLATQPWFDTVVRWEIDPQVYYGKNAVLLAEADAIRTELPLYNVKANEGNPYRIPPPLAIRQRRQRDAAKGELRWVHPADRVATPKPAPVRRWKRWQKQLLGWSVGWAVTTIAGWAGLVWRWDIAVWWHPAAISAATTLALTVWVWLGWTSAGRRLRRRARKMRRALRGWLR